MNKKISRSIVFLAFTFISSLVFADGPLTIQTSADGCPTGVTNDGSCGGGVSNGPACRDTGARVRWISTGNDIVSISEKYEEDPGELRGCTPNGPADYHCSAVGASGDAIEYDVLLEGCPPLDPTIIIR